MQQTRLNDANASADSVRRVVHIITGLGQGGAEGVLYRLLAYQDREQWPALVISLTPGGMMADRIRELGIDVESLDMRPGRLSLPTFFRLIRRLRAWNPDVVQTWMYHANLMGGLAARMAGIRRIFWGLRHSKLDPRVDKRSTILVAQLGGMLSRWVPCRIVCCSNATLAAHLEAGYATDRMVVIPNGYDLTLFHPDVDAHLRLLAERNLPPERKLVGMAARYHPQKDHATFLAAAGLLAARLEDQDFILCGTGMDVNNAGLQDEIQRLGLDERVHLLGAREDMPFVLAGLDVATLTSSVGEGFPNVVAESMACGTLTVATDVGDAAEIVGDSGWIVSPRDPEALAKAWEAALALPAEERMKLAESARARVRTRYNITGMVERYERLYRGEPAQEASS